MATDVVIVGGGVIGSSAAYFLAEAGVPSVTVIEPDPLYERAATSKASGGIRRLFSRPENIAMSQWSLAFYERFAEHVAVDGEAPDLAFERKGYLFIAPTSGIAALEANHRVQLTHGVNAILLDARQLGERFPSMRTDDVGAAVLSPDDGVLDPNAALRGFRAKARALGAEYRRERVAGLSRERDRVTGVILETGEVLRPDAVVVAAGTWSADLCATIDMPLPVEPMRRHDHYFECPTAIEPLPFIKDPSGVGFQQTGRGFTGGLVDHFAAAGHNWDVDHDWFQEVVWPALATRFPALETLKLKATWSGHYDRNRLDRNMVLGNWPGHAENLFVACGFSGHGLMHAPAVGNALAELIVAGRFETLDLSRMDYGRCLRNEPYAELGIV